MAEEAEAAPELSDSERIARLEKSVSFHRMLVIILGALTIILLSSVITGVIVLNAQLADLQAPEPTETAAADDPATGKSLSALEKQLQEQATRLEEIDKSLATQRAVQEIQAVQLMTDVLRQQESGYRAVMVNLKAGMRDLSRMIPGSRTWLEEYEDRMNRSLAGSRERMERLSEISQATGAAEEEEATE